MRFAQGNRFWLHYLLPFLAIFTVLSIYSMKKNEVLELVVQMVARDTTRVQVHVDSGAGFTADNKQEALLKGGEIKILHFSLPKSTQQIRFNPSTQSTEVTITSLQVKRGHSTASPNLLAKVAELNNQIGLPLQDDGTIRMRIDGVPPPIIIAKACIPEKPARHMVGEWTLSILLIAVICTVFIRIALKAGLRTAPRLLYIAISIVLFLALLVVFFSKFNIHPDERGHVIAGQYYKEHWFKLAVDHPAMRETLMPGWRISYLYHPDIIYFLAEKMTNSFSFYFEHDYKRYRFFNFLLLGALVFLFANGSRNGLYFLLALGLSPQIFYIFSYFNGDAPAMFASLLLGYYFLRHRQQFEDFLWGRLKINMKIVVFCLLCVFVMVTRLHYTIFVFYMLGLMIILKPPSQELKKVPIAIFRVLLIFLIVFTMVGLMELKEQQANNFKKSEAVAGIFAESITSEYSKEQILETGYNPIHLHLKDLGVSATDMITRYQWLTVSVKSFFGVYGYLNFFSPNTFFWISAIFGFGPVTLILLAGAWRAGLQYKLLLLYLAAATFAVCAQSLIHSWTVGLAPQGRYLFAVIPMLAVTLCLNPVKVPLVSLYKLAITIYLINAFGFAVYGVIPMLSL